jgi:hypothetical protein
LNTLSNSVWPAYENGTARVTQERVGPEECLYWVTADSFPPPPKPI